MITVYPITILPLNSVSMILFIFLLFYSDHAPDKSLFCRPCAGRKFLCNKGLGIHHPLYFFRKNLGKVRFLATQVALVRPALLFVSAVNISNGRGKGVPIVESVTSIINLVSTMLSMYGLLMLTGLARVRMYMLRQAKS